MRNLVLDSQILSGVQSCAFKTNLTFRKNLRPMTKPTYFDDGDLVHEMLASFYRGQIEGLSYEKRVNRALEEGYQHSAHLDLKGEDVEKMMKVTQEYFEDQELKEDFKVLTVEQPFAFVLGEDEEQDLRVMYVGKIDLVVQTRSGEVRPWDHKTGGKRVAPHLLSNQFMGYCTALGVNLLDVNKIAFIKDEDKFRRYTMNYPAGILDRWRANSMWWAKQLDFYNETDTWPQNFTSCDKYSGCEYTDICSAVSIEAMNLTAQRMFKIGEPWDVSKILSGSKAIPLAEVK